MEKFKKVIKSAKREEVVQERGEKLENQ